MITAHIRGLPALQRKLASLGKVGADAVLARAMYAAGATIEGPTKLNIQEADLIDTSFMFNSVFTSSPKESSYAVARAAAEGCNPDAVMLDEPRAKARQAIVSVGAEYAIYLHEGTSRIAAHPFLYSAFKSNVTRAVKAAEDVLKLEVKKAI